MTPPSPLIESPKIGAAYLLQGDATRLPFADQSVDATFCSPPYTDARTYGIGAQRHCVEWIDWMLGVVTEACRVTRGLVLVNCAGVTRNRVYQPGPEGLLYEWWKRGGVCWRPAYWHRVGIPGSGGKHWLRSDIEYILCFKRDSEWPEWGDNTACGHPPKWGLGGEVSYRHTDGQRRNARTGNRLLRERREKWGGGGTSFGRRANGSKIAPAGINQWGHPIGSGGPTGPIDGVTCGPARPSHTGNGLPVLANPGNLISDLRHLETLNILAHYAIFNHFDSDAVLRILRQAIDSKDLRRWWAGIIIGISGAPLLQSQMSGAGVESSEWSEARRASSSGEKDSSTKNETGNVHRLRPNEQAGGSSRERGCDGQSSRESCGAVPLVSSEKTQAYRMLRSRMQGSILRERVLLAALAEMEEIRRSIDEVLKPSLGPSESANLISIIVGGGVMGSDHASTNEAPFPIGLPEFFIKSFCKPGGTVLDMFSGSGTTCDAARRLGRNAIGMDLRLSQCQLGRRRLAEPIRKPIQKKLAPPIPADECLFEMEESA